jgi:prophage antirepressor-like protein
MSTTNPEETDMNFAPIFHPTSSITYGGHAIRIATRGDKPWLVATDLAAIFPHISDTIANELNEDERWSALLPDGDRTVISPRGAVLASCLLGGATEPGEPEYAFRVWLFDEALPAIENLQPSCAPAVTDPKQRRLLDAIKRLGGSTLSELARASQSMRRSDRHAALAALEARGLVVAVTENSGGRPLTIYRLPQPAPAA